MKTKIFSLIALAFLAIVSFSSCEKESNDPAPLTVVSVSPLNGATNVPTTTVVKIDLDKDIDPNTVEAALKFFEAAGKPVSIDFKADARSISFVQNTGSLEPGMKYTITLKGLKAKDGGILKDFTSTFTTKSLPFAVVSITPAHQSVGVAQNAKIVIVFNKKVNPNVVDGKAGLVSAGEPVLWTSTFDGNKTVTLTPKNGLVKNMMYIVYLTDVKAADGETLPDYPMHYFQTGNW